MQRRVAIVTGATRGIGLETARGLASRGWHLVLACRDVVKAHAVRDRLCAEHPACAVSVVHLDLASLGSVRRCAGEVRVAHPRIHLLVDNAGVFCDTRQHTVDGFEATIGVNFLGTLLLTRLLMPALVETAAHDGHARVVIVSSAAAAFGRLRPGERMFIDGPTGFPGYAASKLALVHLAVGLSEELADTGVTVNAVHPGDAATGIWRGDTLLMRVIAPLMRRWLRTPEDAARAVLHAAVAPELERVSGVFLGAHGEVLRARRYEDHALRTEVLRRALGAVGLG